MLNECTMTRFASFTGRVPLFLLAILVAASSAHADKGPIWTMKLPVRQRALLAPYARFAAKEKASRARDRREYASYLNRAIQDDPASLALLNAHPERRAPNVPFSFPFENTGSVMEGIAEVDFGFCLGFTYMLRKFNILATFRPELPRLARAEDYFPRIDAIAEDSPDVIPGYPDLHTFAADPRIARYLKLHIADEWAKRNVSRSGLRVYAEGFGALKPRETDRLLSDIRRVLDLGVNPIIYFALDPDAMPALFAEIAARVCAAEPGACAAVKEALAKEEKKGWIDKIVERTGMIHVVQVYDVRTDAEGKTHLLVWDINAPAKRASTDLVVDASRGTARFPLSADLGKGGTASVPANVKAIAIHPDEHAEIGRMLYNLSHSR